MNKNLYVAVGPGLVHPQHQAVMDSIPGEWEFSDKYVVQPGILNYDVFDLPYKPGTINAIYSSHLLEHISHLEIKKLIDYWHTMLREGGRLIINVPDLEWMCFAFLEVLVAERTGQQLDTYYNSSIGYNEKDAEHNFLQPFYGSQVHDGEYHKCGFTKESLSKLLAISGFTIDSIKQEFEAHDLGCLIVYATK